MSNRSALRAIVYGLVQGVNYRYFVQRHAEAIGLTGYAKNLDDGSVEVFAEGEKDKLAQLVAKLKAGPRAARVERVDVEWGEYSGKYRGFDIVF
ncbi:MAG: acylphosphatase [Dehalococcoidia bacterium]|jgi:acylphosphatase